VTSSRRTGEPLSRRGRLVVQMMRMGRSAGMICVGVLAVAISAACFGDEAADNGGPSPDTVTPTVRPESTATVTDVAPTATPTVDLEPTAGPPPTEPPVLTGIPSVDRVISAVESRDLRALQGFVKYTSIECVAEDQGLGSPPPCPTGVAPGTLVNVLPGAACHGYYVPEWEVRFDGLDDYDLELAAVLEAETTRPGPPPHEIVYRDRTNDTALIFSVVEEGIWQTRTSCGPGPGGHPLHRGEGSLRDRLAEVRRQTGRLVNFR
jgi:hypothetical protein